MTLSSTDYALLAQDAYQDPVLNKPKILGGVTYEAFDTQNDPVTGFQATAYKRMDTGEVVIAYRGTEFDREPVQDGGVDAAMVLTGVNLQSPDSEAFTQRVLEKARLDAELHHRPLQVTVTGHSLGGTLAEINAAKYGLHGETFNAYGAASLKGIPEGGNTVIDHVRAGDLVSAASPHYGQVRVYAAQQDIDTLQHAGYRDDSGILSLRNPIKATDFDAHAIDNFVPNSKLLGQSIIAPENEARYEAHKGMVDRYRNDVADIRLGLSATWEIPKAIGEFKDNLEHKAFELAGEGILAVEHGIENVVNEAKEGFEHLKEGFEHVKDEISEGIHTFEEKASGVWHTLTHPKEWFEHDKPQVALDHPQHPDNALFKKVLEGVHQVDAKQGRTPDQLSDNLAASLTVAARKEGLDKVNHVLLDDPGVRTYAVQGELNSPLKQLASVDTAQAVATPVAQSSAQWQQAAETRQAQQNEALAQQNTQQQANRPNHGVAGP
ncbi:MAG TPA: XVIPCD domain-containing protein [Luteibacter sp.]|uniref:XVIPCD domain-containing protein n=1 Tax=Luteibacter sp. TaxID=1886636 RepID=UPI002F42CF49